MKLILILIFLAFTAPAFAQVEVTHTGIQGNAGSRYAIFVFKNTAKKPLKNIVVAFNVKIKLVKGAKQWESENTEMAEVKEIKAGQSYEHKQNFNDAVVQIISSSLSSVIPR
jgi:hypothetical protein